MATNNIQSQNNLYMLTEGARADAERQSSASNHMRDLMEQMNPLNVLNGIAEVLMKVLGAVSG